MSLSPEMTRYITTGQCPRCDVQILSPSDLFMLKRSAPLSPNDRPGKFLSLMPRRAGQVVIGPVGEDLGIRWMQCLTCMKKWPIWEDSGVGLKRGRRDDSGGILMRLGEGTSGEVLKVPIELIYDKDGHLIEEPRLHPDPKSSQPVLPPRVVSAPSPVVLKRPTLVRVSEAPTRRSEPIGDEVRSFNNAKSSSTSVERITVRHETDVSASVDLTKTRALSGGAGVSFMDVVSAQASLGNDLARHYSRRMDEKLTFEQQTEVNIPAYKHVKIIFHWYRIRATGMLTIAEQARRAVEVAEVPFEITVGLTFDKKTRDKKTRDI